MRVTNLWLKTQISSIRLNEKVPQPIKFDLKNSFFGVFFERFNESYEKWTQKSQNNTNLPQKWAIIVIFQKTR